MNRYGLSNFGHTPGSMEKVIDLLPCDAWLSAERCLVGDRSGFAPSGITQHDADGRIIGADDEARRIFSKLSVEYLGSKFSDPQMGIIQGDGRQLTEDEDPVKIALQSGEIISDVQLGFQQPEDADAHWVLLTAIPVTGVNGNPHCRVVCQIRGINEYIQHEGYAQFRFDLIQQLRKVSEIQALDAQDLDPICQEILRLIPDFLVFPDATHIRIRLDQNEWSSRNFKISKHRHVFPICRRNTKFGEIGFHYPDDPANHLSESELQGDEVLGQTLAEWLGLIALVVKKNQEITQLKDEALTAYDRTIEAWSAALETSDKEAGGHTRRVTELAVELAREMGFPDEDLINVRRGALLHDIGKLSIPDEIILKPGKLTEDEYEIVKKHPEFTQKWLSQIELLKPALQIPYCHHERWDGTGYPQGLAGEEIPLAARMFSVVDVWDALISDRPYRRAMSKAEALDLILCESGSQFDPEVVKHFVNILQAEDRIHSSHELKINAFQQARVWRHSCPVTIKEWEIYAARDLFFLFMANPKGLSKEQVGLNMWPDLSPDELDLRFKNTLYRLRRALGKQTILLTGECYHFNRMLDYRYDVACFMTHIEKAKESPDLANKRSHLIKAIEQYHGDYLREIEELWVVNDRERYRMLFLGALVEVAELLIEQQDLNAALAYVNRALGEDPLLEVGHRLAMEIYSKLGDRAGVIRQYEACRSALAEKFDVSPSKETRELYEFLIQA